VRTFSPPREHFLSDITEVLGNIIGDIVQIPDDIGVLLLG